MTIRPRLLLISLLSVSLALSGMVEAAPPTPDDPFSAKAEPQADALLLRGVEHFKRQEYEAARVAFARSYELAPRTGTLLNLALAELQSEKPLQAAKHFRLFLHAPDAPSDKLEYVHTKMLPRAEALSARVQIDASAGSDVLVDGDIVGRAPLSDVVDVGPGEHVVEVRLGTNVQRLTTQAPIGSLTRVRIEIVAPQQTIQIHTSMAPPVAATASAPPRDEPRAKSWSTEKTVAVIGLASLAVSGSILGTVFAVSASNDASNADSLRSTLSSSSSCYTLPGQPMSYTCQQLQSAIASQHDNVSLATGFYVTSGVAAAGAVAAWLLWPNQASKGKDTQAWISPLVGDVKGVSVGSKW